MGQSTEPRVNSYVNDIDGVTIDEEGVIQTPYGSYHPTTGEGLPINAPKDLMREILIALIRDGEESGIAKDFDFDEIIAELRSDKEQ